MNLMLQNKVVLVTGATGGIGKQICADFLKEKSIVAAVYRNEKKYSDLKLFLQDQGIELINLLGLKINSLDKTEIDAAVKSLVSDHKTVDVLINCAGSSLEVPFAMMEEKDIAQTIDINLKSPMFYAQAVLRPMFKQKSGAIINISTIATHKAGRGIVVYASAKSGIDSFTRTLAQEVGRKNIRVNCIRPGVIDTTMSQPLMARTGGKIVDMTALNRLGKPEDISAAALYLASEKLSAFVSGTCLNVDGGLNL